MHLSLATACPRSARYEPSRGRSERCGLLPPRAIRPRPRHPERAGAMHRFQTSPARTRRCGTGGSGPRTAMRREGLEPSRPRGPGLLRPGCLPIPAPARASHVSNKECTGRDSNPHTLSGPAISGPVVYQFQHLRSSLPAPFVVSRTNEVGMTGFEPATSCIPSTRSHQAELHPDLVKLIVASKESGRQDLNLRPPGSEPGALPGWATSRGSAREGSNLQPPHS